MLIHGHALHSGDGNSPTYGCWRAMIRRCSERKKKAWKHYGSRGIKVCERWLDFRNFLTDMGERPKGLTLDRYPNLNGNYEPGNVRWATRSQQQNNRRDNIVLELNGERKTVAEWARLLGVRRLALSYRFRAGWKDEDILTIPIQKRRK